MTLAFYKRCEMGGRTQMAEQGRGRERTEAAGRQSPAPERSSLVYQPQRLYAHRASLRRSEQHSHLCSE